LADANRLKIIGLLARHPHTVEQLAEILELGASTTSHHLAKLNRAGLVSARPEGHYYLYQLELDVLQNMSRRLLSEGDIKELSADANLDVYGKKVLANFTDKEGRITAFPAQERKFLVIIRYVMKAFEPGERYPEKKVNDILSFYNEDTALLRRSLVSYGFMKREGGGGEYWINEEA
jgi:hypothetical protein